jgi:signal transduction histidine kinase
MSIRTKLTLVIAGLLSVTVAVAGGALYWAERHTLVRKIQESRRSLAEHFTQTCLDALVMNDDLAALNAASDLARAAGVRAAFAVDGRGRVRAHSDVRRVGQPAPVAPEGVDDAWVSGRRTTGDETITGVVVVSRSATAAEIRRSLAAASRRIAGGLLFALALGALGAWVSARHITRPLRVIAEGTHRLAEGNRDHRIAIDRADELGVLARDFNRMAAALGELDAMKDDFVSNVTHELRSPISAIESYVNLMTDRARQGRAEDLIDHLTIVRNNAARLGKFVNDILDLAKIDSRGLIVEKSAVDARRALADTAALFAAKAREKSIAVVVDDAPPGLTVQADADKLQQILINLVGNALKFTPAGGRVALSASSMDRDGKSFVRLSVADTGPGIAPEDQARIFDRFEQVRERRTAPGGAKGTGLGLAITRGLVEAHGGMMTLESAPGRGAAFHAWFPR